MNWTSFAAAIFFLSLPVVVGLLVADRLRHPARNGHGAELEAVWDGRERRKKKRDA